MWCNTGNGILIRLMFIHRIFDLSTISIVLVNLPTVPNCLTDKSHIFPDLNFIFTDEFLKVRCYTLLVAPDYRDKLLLLFFQ